MKQIIETKLVEQTTTKFFSDDGKEFLSESDCKNYEYKQNRERVERDFKNLDCKKITPFIFDWWNCSDMYACKITSQMDVSTLEAYFGMKFYDYKFIKEEKIYFVISDCDDIIIMKKESLIKYLETETENLTKLKEFFGDEINIV